MLNAISPIDGRYSDKVKQLSPYFSEKALIRYRVMVEVEYFIHLTEVPLPQLKDWQEEWSELLRSSYKNFSDRNAQKVKDTEKIINHDVKAVEYFVKDELKSIGAGRFAEFVHFGLTSQDINNTAFPLMIKDGMDKVILPQIQHLRNKMYEMAEDRSIPMLARTHGQPASPTGLGKEIMVFVERLDRQIRGLKKLPITAKFGGATGNFNAHLVAYPNIDWIDFSNRFIKGLGMQRLQYTTQIQHYDNMAAIFDALSRINTIFLDFARDIWTYVMLEYFKQKVVAKEVGSSAMPHKVNPIDFENAEGNLGMANAILRFLSEKLPVSRLQRDLTDSTVLRNVGVPLGHMLIALKSLDKGIGKLLPNVKKIKADLEDNYLILAEAVQTILRREGVQKPYELLKDLTRGQSVISKDKWQKFLKKLPVTDSVKQELLSISPTSYTGYACIPFEEEEE